MPTIIAERMDTLGNRQPNGGVQPNSGPMMANISGWRTEGEAGSGRGAGGRQGPRYMRVKGRWAMKPQASTSERQPGLASSMSM